MTSEKAPELKPCPFCGGRARIARDNFTDEHGVFLHVECVECRAKSSQKYYSHGNDCPLTYEGVRDLWNRRADVADAMVAVNPLEWRHVPDEPQGYTWRARKPFGSSYYLHEKDGLHSWGGEYVSLEDAKAAAQADYEARIFSALQSPSDAHAALAEAERKAWNAALEAAEAEVHQECWTDGVGGSVTETLLAEQSTTSLALRAIAALKKEPEACECTKIEQDESCPVGYPSLLCEKCDGKGHQ